MAAHKDACPIIVGGHTVDDSEPKFGLCVTGFVHPQRIWRNVGAKPGDRLILTKPLGTGIVTTALRAQKAKPQHVQAAIESMATLNARAAEAGRRIGIHACTDITGFGFLGHLQEMLGNDGVGARIKMSAVPLLPGLRDLLTGGFVPGGARRNRAFVERRLQVETGVSDDHVMILCDPQTSGGLLFAVDGQRSATLVRELEAEKVATIAEVGEVIGPNERQIHIVR
jgi:selenide,water dikinase